MTKRISVSIQAASILFITSCIVSAVDLRKFPGFDFSLFTLSASVPLVSSAVLVFLTILLPPLAPEPESGYATAATFPIVHSAVMLAVTRLLLTTPDAMELLPPKLEATRIWQHWTVLIICAVLGFVALSLKTMFTPPRKS